MRALLSKTVIPGIAGSFVLALALTVYASPPKHRHKDRHSGNRTAVSAQQARAAARKKEQLRHRLSGLHSHMRQVKSKIHKAKVQENQITENIETVEDRIARTKQNLTRVNTRLIQLDTRHTRVVARLRQTQDRLAVRRRLLAQRISDNYQRGQTTYVQVLLQSRSVHDMLSRGYYVRQIVHSDAELIAGVQQDIKQIETDKKTLEAQEREQKALASEFETQKAQYAADLNRKQQLLAGVQEVREHAEEELDDLEGEANAMTGEIRELSQILQRRREAERQAQAQSGHGGRHRRQNSVIAPVWHGGFMRPCDGPITSGFGIRYHPILHRRKMHTGVDFGAGYGAPIRAAAGGTVILAHYTSGYGNCVIIDHGNGVTTLYGHCSDILVSRDQVVSQGSVIAHVGATGMATGPHLHFEVRHNGTPVRPL
jgi:murein DD-endopeptidase MepM/ murein hydrolase activator NlpD